MRNLQTYNKFRIVERRRIKEVRISFKNSPDEGHNIIEPKNNNPAKILEENDVEPIGGKQDVRVVIVSPNDVNEAYIKLLEECLVERYASLKLGSLTRENVILYNGKGNLATTIVKVLGDRSVNYDPNKHFFIVVLPGKIEELNNVVRGTLTDNSFHSQIILKDTLEKLDNRKFRTAFATNICLAIYYEFLLQKSTVNKDFFKGLNGLTWRLTVPADNREDTVFIGFDTSWKIVKGGHKAFGAAFAIVFDSYGRLLGGYSSNIVGDKIDEITAIRVIQNVFNTAKKRGFKRVSKIVLYRDGNLRLSEVRLFSKLAKEFDVEVAFRGVIKRHIRRLYTFSEDAGRVGNPRSGDWVYLGYSKTPYGDVKKFLIVSTTPAAPIYAAGGVKKTVAPIFLEVIDNSLSEEEIAKEYLRLCHLNFQCWHGANKLALPVLVADQLAGIIRGGVTPKFPQL